MLDVGGFLINIIACAMQGHFRSRQRLPSESEIDERIIPLETSDAVQITSAISTSAASA